MVAVGGGVDMKCAIVVAALYAIVVASLYMMSPHLVNVHTWAEMQGSFVEI